jgi:hypothetical protein
MENGVADQQQEKQQNRNTKSGEETMGENDKQDATISDCTATFNNSEAQTITVKTRHYVDGLLRTEFEFRMVASTAVLHKITPPDQSLNLKQNKPAWNKARETVEDLPFVQAVEML